MSSDSAPTRILPDQPNLVQLRKQAKELLKSYRAGESVAIAEVERFERTPDPANFSLADAQRVLARAYGFSSWTKLKQHVDDVNVETFCTAAESGDVAMVLKLAQARSELVNIERGGQFGERIALHFAVLNRDSKMTRVLMELGSDARRGIWPHRDATAAFTIARERGYGEIVAIIEQAEERRRKEMSSVDATLSSKTDEIIKAILEDRSDEAIQILESDLSLVGACNLGGVTPLHVAAWSHNPAMVGWLLDHGAAVDAQAQYDVPVRLQRGERKVPGRTPLDYAAIVAGWAPEGRDSIFYFMENARKDRALFYETVQLLRSRGAVLTPHAAVAVGDKEAVLQMHREGRLRNEVHRLRGGLVTIAVRVNRIDMVLLLLDLGFDPDESFTAEDGIIESKGMPLWTASMCGWHEIAELLLARGADVNAIVFACGDSICTAADEKMTALLRKHGARLTVETVTDRETAQAILEGTIPAYSLNVPEPTLTDLAEQMLWASAGSNSEIVRMCLPYMKRKHDDPWWNYVLIHATLPDSLKLVLDYGVDPDVEGDGGFTILHHLTTNDCHVQNRLTHATLLLDAGAALIKRDQLLKSTPLGWACRWGCHELVQFFLERGADPWEPEAEPWARPLAWATMHGYQDIIELLGEHGVS